MQATLASGARRSTRAKLQRGSKLSTHTGSDTKTKRRKLELKEEKEVGKTLPKVWIGAHVSGAGGVENAILNAKKTKSKAFAFFVRSQRKWTSPPLQPETIAKFQQAMHTSGYLPQQIVVHGSYLLNCGSADAELNKKSLDGMLDEVARCQALGIRYYNFHPGSATNGMDRDECIKNIAKCVNIVHRQIGDVVILLENMSNQGNTIGGAFEELQAIIELVEEKSRVGVCFDTCHAFAAGFDIKKEDVYEQTFRSFDEIIGLEKLKAFHLNDSKGQCGCKKDRHEKIGKGFLGIEFFQRLITDPRFIEIPMILETPIVNKKDANPEYAEEIELLYSLIE